MRVVSGSARGRKLKDYFGNEIRPTSDMVKESIFNIVQFDIEGRRILDLFAGTGQIGIEALSRGARSVVFVDSSRDAVRLIRENLKLCGFIDSSTILMRDALQYLKHCEKFDLIFMDPPYDMQLAGKAVDRIIEFDKLNANGIIVCETRDDKSLSDVRPHGFSHKEYKYGRVKITRYEHSSLSREL